MGRVVMVGFVLCFLLATGCERSTPRHAGSASGTSKRKTSKATSTPSATVAGPSSTPTVGALSSESFVMPSRNISCYYFSSSGGGLRCDGPLNPEPTGPCRLDWTGLYLNPIGPAGPECAGGSVYSNTAPMLAYGRTWQRGGIECLSQETGLRCVNQNGHGFTLARAGYTFFSSTPSVAALSSDSFIMPSGNIACLFSSSALRCDILSGLNPEPTTACELDWTGLYLEKAGGAGPQCAGDTVLSNSAATLAYGRTWRRSGIECLSVETGLRCANQNRHGFTLARAGYKVF